MAEAMEAIAGDDGNGTYTVILKDNAAMGLDDGSSNTCSLPAKTIVLDGCGYKLSQPVTSRNYLGINGNLTLKNVELDMNLTYLYNYADGAEITFEGTVTGKLGLAQDKTDKNAEGATFVVCSPVSKTILADLIRRLFLQREAVLLPCVNWFWKIRMFLFSRLLMIVRPLRFPEAEASLFLPERR